MILRLDPTQNSGDNNRLAQLKESVDGEAVVLDGLDEAIIGHGSQFPSEPVIVYSAQRILDVLVGDGMAAEEALEFFQYNIEAMSAGDLTPIIIWEIEE